MKRVLVLSACVVLLFTTLQYGQPLTHEKILYHSEAGVRWTQCVFGPDGVLWVIWVPGNTNAQSGGPIWVLSYDGNTVSMPANLTNISTIKANRPHISVSPKGQILASWGVVGTKSVYMRIRDHKTKTWGEIIPVAEGYGGDEPCAQMDKNGNIHVFFSDESGGQIFVRSRINGVWENVVKLSQGRGKQGSLAVGSDGRAHAVWIEKGASGLYENVYTNRTATTSWYTREGLPGESGASNHPWIAVGPNNKAIVAWQDISHPDLENGSEIRVLELGSTWETVISFMMQHFPRVIVDRHNKIHVACQTGGGDFGSGLRYTNNVKGTWMNPQQLLASMPKVPGLSADPAGNVAATMSSWTTTGNHTGSDIKVWSLNPIKKIPVLEADFTYAPTTGYFPLPVKFTATKAFGVDGKEVGYDWDFGDGGTGSGRIANHTFQTGGTFDVTLTISDDADRSDSLTKSIAINYTPLPAAQFTFSPTTGYPPLPVNFAATEALGADGKEVKYGWDFGDGGTGSGRTTVHTYLTAGTFDVTLTITDNINRTNSLTKSILVLKTNPLVPVGLSATITLSQFWKNPEITFNLFWATNPDNIPEHIEAYAIYMKEDSGDYIRLLTLSPSTLSVSFKFTDMTKKRSFAISSLGYGGTESTWGYFK
ncbi:MAG: PKD domain-containing protein [Candidatus Aminicenantes bacterium]|nr:PKD domain-containing protein [Candidatus Aminicenantes bacterium]